MRNPAKMMEILQSDSFAGSGIFHQDDSVAGSKQGNAVKDLLKKSSNKIRSAKFQLFDALSTKEAREG
jgi:hypothetical protein